MQVDAIEMPELRVAAVQHKGPYNQISAAFARLGQVAGAAGLFGPDAPLLAIYHDDPRTTPASDLRSEAAVVLTPDKSVPEGLGEDRVPGGRYARTTHVGPYAKLAEVWPRFMGEGLTSSGLRLRDGVSYEIYRNTPGQVPDDKLITEIYVPVE